MCNETKLGGRLERVPAQKRHEDMSNVSRPSGKIALSSVKRFPRVRCFRDLDKMLLVPSEITRLKIPSRAKISVRIVSGRLSNGMLNCFSSSRVRVPRGMDPFHKGALNFPKMNKVQMVAGSHPGDIITLKFPFTVSSVIERLSIGIPFQLS